MKKLFAAFFVFILACKPSSPLSAKEELIKTMSGFMNEQAKKDSGKVSYEIKDVIYFDDKSFYICDFTVHMKTSTLDSTGIMRARISKDYKTVVRNY
ncbi:MAG TPA: hypothetical protein PL045_00710 [Chitinophagaceae bacterium]|nr:hypothetical protein [Chitinophagaceae bacterium]